MGISRLVNSSSNLVEKSYNRKLPFLIEGELFVFPRKVIKISRGIENGKGGEFMRFQTINTLQKENNSITDLFERYSEPIYKGHSIRVAKYMAAMRSALTAAGDYRLNMYTERDVAVAGMLHDIGKALLPHDLLAKDGPLDNAEIRLMQSHPVMGAKFIESHPLEHDVHRELLMDTIKCHHERWDGMGYPEGLKEEGIPLIARLCAIADTYDAVVSDRPYRKGVEAAIALNELRKAAGTQLDPYLVRCLLEKPDWMRI